MQRLLRRAVAPQLALRMSTRAVAPVMRSANIFGAAALTTPMRFASLSEEMADELASEEAREDKPTCPEVPENWSVHHKPTDAFFSMTRTYRDEELMIYCQLQVTDPEIAEKGENSEEHFPFTLLVNRGGKTLDFTLTHIEGELVIDGVSHHDSQQLAADMTAEGLTQKERKYQGPGISELSSEVVAAFADYLTERGVTDEFAVFIADYSYWIEEAHYHKWLKQIQEFTK